MDAITLLKEDHQRVEKIFKKFENAGERAYAEKRKLVDKMIEELSVHAAIEEQIFYPATRELVPDVEKIALESLEEHHVVKWLLAELEKMDAQDERFVAKTTVLIENVRHHVEEEEGEYFPEVREALGRNALGEIGDAMVDMKPTAPTRPHPRMPDEGIAGTAAASAGGVMDKVGGTISGLTQGGVAALRDVTDKVRGVETNRPRPTGSSRTQRTADTVRSEVDERLEQLISSIREAQDAGSKAVDDARSTAKNTASEAKKGASRTTRAAKGDTVRS